MTEKNPKPQAKAEKPEALETMRLGDLSGGVSPTDPPQDLGDEEMRKTTGG